LKYIESGDPQLIATELKVDVEKIKPYFNRDRSWEVVSKKAFPEDIYELMHGLVFIDFWEKLGIRFPKHGTKPKYKFELSDEFIIKDHKKAVSERPGCNIWEPYL